MTHIYNWAGCHITAYVCVEGRGTVYVCVSEDDAFPDLWGNLFPG